jgi:hypothetical protein
LAVLLIALVVEMATTRLLLDLVSRANDGSALLSNLLRVQTERKQAEGTQKTRTRARANEEKEKTMITRMFSFGEQAEARRRKRKKTQKMK